MTTLRPGEPTPADGWPAWLAWHKAQGSSKRFAEAELCAEYESARCDALILYATDRCWQPLGATWPMDRGSIYGRAQTLLRFATTPHYDEVQP